MPRKHPEPFRREQTLCFYLQVGKKQHGLDPNEDTAWRLSIARPPERSRIASPSPKLAAVEVVDLFLESASVDRERPTCEAYKRRLQKLVDAIPSTVRDPSSIASLTTTQT